MRKSILPGKPQNLRRNQSTNSNASSSLSQRTIAVPLDKTKNKKQQQLANATSTHIKISGDSPDNDNDDIDFALKYNKYLQTIMEKVITEKKVKKETDVTITSLAAVGQEYDLVQEKLLNIKRRNNDIINLTNLQTETDKEISKVTKSHEKILDKEMTDIISQLRSVLKGLNVLKCDDIVLPKTKEEWKEFKDSLEKCKSNLMSIQCLIGERGERYNEMYEKLKEFTETFHDIENQQEKFEKNLCDLQVLVLKHVSRSLNLVNL